MMEVALKRCCDKGHEQSGFVHTRVRLGEGVHVQKIPVEIDKVNVFILSSSYNTTLYLSVLNDLIKQRSKVSTPRHTPVSWLHRRKDSILSYSRADGGEEEEQQRQIEYTAHVQWLEQAEECGGN